MTDQQPAMPLRRTSIAYFSMEIGLQSDMPTYSGGLGILAGDVIRTAADMEVPLVGVTLLPRKGYLHQRLDASGNQIEESESWKPQEHLRQLPQRVAVAIEKREVTIRAWQYDAVGMTGFTVPVLFLDTDLPANDKKDRELSYHLYGGGDHCRLCQEYVLGVGGVRMLRALGYEHIDRFHMNEGHAAFLILQLFNEELERTGGRGIRPEHIEGVRRRCVFTTHTPVPAGHDQFPMSLVRRVIGPHRVWHIEGELSGNGDTLNMTHLAMNFSHYVNGVSKQHGRTSQEMFSAYQIDAITNGVHAATWTARPIRRLLDRYIPAWREDNVSIRYALSVPPEEIWEAHTRCKSNLMRYVAKQQKVKLNPRAFTIGFARRATAYKRADLILGDVDRLRQIADRTGAFQIIFAGKAHPKDEPGKGLIRHIFEASKTLRSDVHIVYLPNYDIDVAKVLIPGVDLWLNTPLPPHEASGTSGMKAALNGVPSLSILDGWWIEGCVENLTGWAIGGRSRTRRATRADPSAKDAAAMYDKLEDVIIPMFYNDRERYIRIMRFAMALNGSFFNTQRMLQEYLLKAYLQ